MRIDKVTITGADDKISPLDLLELQNEFPFVEWGILFSKIKHGTPRYPSLEWIEYLFDYDLNLSAHFCGWYSREVLENHNTSLFHHYEKNFTRFQLNYNFSNTYDKSFSFAPIIDWADTTPNNSIILQYNKSNTKWLDFPFPKNIHFLYDSSGGRGKEMEDIQNPFFRYTGYSGGITPKNIKRVCKEITEGEFQNFVWIDMESGVRTENGVDFDIDKVRICLEIASEFITNKEDF